MLGGFNDECPDFTDPQLNGTELLYIQVLGKARQLCAVCNWYAGDHNAYLRGCLPTTETTSFDFMGFDTTTYTVQVNITVTPTTQPTTKTTTTKAVTTTKAATTKATTVVQTNTTQVPAG
jgi:hypothetical protein